MHVDDERVALVGVEAVWLHDEILHAVAVGSDHPVGLRGSDVDLCLQLVVEVCDLFLGESVAALAGSGGVVEGHGLACGGVGVVEPALAVGLKGANGAVGHELVEASVLDAHLVEGLVAALLAEEIDAL